MFFSAGALFGRAAAIDLGTVNTVVAIEGRMRNGFTAARRAG